MSASTAGKRSSNIPRKLMSGVGKGIRKLRITRILKRNSSGYGSMPSVDDEGHEVETNYMNNVKNEENFSSGTDSNEFLPLALDPTEANTSNNGAILNSNSNLSQANANFLYPVERSLRLICIIVGSFYLGASWGSSMILVVFKVFEYALVAWFTSVLILAVLRMNAGSEVSTTANDGPNILSYTRSVVTNTTGPNDDFSETIDTLNNTTSDAGTSLLDIPHINPVRSPPKVVTSDPKNAIEGVRTLNGQHPETQKIHIVTSDGLPERIIPNTIVRYESDICVGNIMMMIRTPDADVAKKPPNKFGMNEQALKVSDYFRPKQRRLVCQFQVKLKEVPKGDIYMGVEFDEPIKMGIIQRALIHAGLGFIKKTNRGFHYSMTGGDGTNHHFASAEYLEKGEYELPHLAFPIIGCMDTIIVSKPGDPLPRLGGEIHERPESVKSRKKGGMGDFTGWNTEDTYTLVVYTAYIDWIKWKCVNLPGIRPFSVCALCGDQAINLTTYAHEGGDDPRKLHLVKDKTYISSLEFSSPGKSTGKTIKKWLGLTESEKTIQSQEKSFAITENERNARNIKDELEDDVDEDDDEDDEDEDDNVDIEVEGEEDDVMEELGGGMYLTCGDPIVLRDASEYIEEENTEIERERSYVTNSFGFAVMQSQSPSNIVFEKASASRQKWKRRNRSKSKLIRNGDTVFIKMLTEKQESKYLTLYKGWWLKWVSRVPRKNGYFQVFTKGDEDMNNSTPSIELQSTYLSLGASFSLRHHRWPSFEVGVGIDRSTKFGGRILGIHRWKGSDNEQTPREKSKFQSLRFSGHQTFSLSHENLSNSDSSDHPSSIDMKNVRLDASAWIEMMHRTMRTRQRVYIIRMKYDDVNTKCIDVENSIESTTIEERIVSHDSTVKKVPSISKVTMRLRTGQDLAPLLQMGRSHKISNVIASSITRGTKMDDQHDGDKAQKKSTKEDSAPGNTENDLVHDSEDINEYEEQLSDEDYDTDFGEDIDEYEGEVNESVDHPDLPHLGSLESISLQLESGVPAISSPSRLYEGNDREQLSEIDTRNSNANVINNELNEDNQSDDESVVCDEENASSRQSSERRKTKKWMKTTSRVAKSVKYGTTKTSKQVVKQTVNAGRFISKGIVHKKKKRQPTRNEPRIRTPKHTKERRKKKWRDHYVAVNKVMKNYAPLNTTGRIFAAQMTAPDQSLRIVSHFLSEMTSNFVPLTSQAKFTPIFSTKFNPPSELDTWFLSGDAADLGVTQSKNEGVLLDDFVVARCLWESHWREEWCGIYEDHISFYAPCSRKALFSLPFNEMLNIRILDLLDERNPLPGLCFLVIESVWRCHYLAFNFRKTRDIFFHLIKKSLSAHPNEESPHENNSSKHGTREKSKDSWKSVQWANFHALDASILSEGRGQWARISSSKKSKKRIILNNRRMSFDVNLFQPSLTPTNENEQEKNARDYSMAKFSAELLRQALSLSLKSMERDVEAFVRFLDMTSRLRGMPIHMLDLSSKEAFCIFVNIYHCLIQHTLLLQGPPSKRSIGHFMHCNCYEIGGDIMSLSELECFVIRGELSNSVHARPPFVNAPKASKAYHIYSLTRVDPRINFVLNNGSSSNLSEVPIFNSHKLEEQLDQASSRYLRSRLIIDRKKQLITLPKVCEIYRNDFGDGAAVQCLTYCIRFLADEDQKMAIDILKTGSGGYTIKFQSSSDTFHSHLARMDDPLFTI